MYSTDQLRKEAGHMHKHSLPKAKDFFHWMLDLVGNK